MNHLKSILEKGQIIDNKYLVRFYLKRGKYTETYRVHNEANETKFLKLYDYSKLHRTHFIDNGDVLEIQILKHINHPNVLKYNDSGNVIIDGKKFAYIVLDFISGETLADKMKRNQTLNIYETKDIVLGVLNGLNYLHSFDNPIIHNDITNLNIMTDLSGNISIAKIIDFGHARFLQQSNNDFLKEGLNPFYQANESFNNVFSIQSDLFSVGALYYHLLVGLPPWFIDISRYKSDSDKLESAILDERLKPLLFSDNIDLKTQSIIIKALHYNTERRFKNAKEFIKAINGELEIEYHTIKEKDVSIRPKTKKNGGGFADIAGMQKLKETLQVDVIDALNNKEKYTEYGLSIPNGMLLYGPPGCGKTFFAEKLAEEIGFNFYQIKPSDIQSKWVNASQENIKELFDEAREKAPSIIFIDELDAVMPSRDTQNISHMNTSAVNEFLVQMNNCGDDGIYVIGATNRPNSIDSAILRAGRLDKTIYIPPPDFEAREQMFKLYLNKRPKEIGIDYSDLANATKNYVSSDIKFLCDEAARQALRLNSRISKEILLGTINNNRPSVSLNELNSYESIRAKMEGLKENTNERPRIGFKK